MTPTPEFSPPVFAVRLTPRGWRCSCAWCQLPRWNGSEPDRHPFLCEPIARDHVAPKPSGLIVQLPRREAKA